MRQHHHNDPPDDTGSQSDVLCHSRTRHPRMPYTSTATAIPWPPPTHIVRSAAPPPIRRSSWRALTARIPPVAPMGWPSEIPEPLMLM